MTVFLDVPKKLIYVHNNSTKNVAEVWDLVFMTKNKIPFL